jgi:septum formation protein
MGEQLPFRLILASGSAGRRELLTQAGYLFEVLPSNIDEPTEGFRDARTLVAHVAWLKAAAVAQRLKAEPTTGPTVILAADSVGWLHGRPILKPADEADARRILHTLAGTQHELWTGTVLWRLPDDLQLAWQEVSLVAMTALDDAAIDRYLATRTWQGCSGAYAVQGENDPYVQVLRGSMSNVVGLPMETLAQVIRLLA